MSEASSDLGNVQALHRLHVLVAAQDRRFQRMAGFLLARAGLKVSMLRKVSDVLSTVREIARTW